LSHKPAALREWIEAAGAQPCASCLVAAGQIRTHGRPGFQQGTAPALLEALPSAPVAIADRGYDWQHLIDLVSLRGVHAHIPTKRDRKVQPRPCRTVLLQAEHFRRVPTWFDKACQKLPRRRRPRFAQTVDQNLRAHFLEAVTKWAPVDVAC